jgi:hypothetical protein
MAFDTRLARYKAEDMLTEGRLKLIEGGDRVVAAINAVRDHELWRGEYGSFSAWLNAHIDSGLLDVLTSLDESLRPKVEQAQLPAQLRPSGDIDDYVEFYPRHTFDKPRSARRK